MGTFEEQSWVCEDQATQSFAHSCMDSEAPAQYIPAAGDNDTQEWLRGQTENNPTEKVSSTEIKQVILNAVSILRCALQEHDWKGNKNALGGTQQQQD